MQLFLSRAQYTDTTAQAHDYQHRDEGNNAAEKHDLRGWVSGAEPFNGGVHQRKQQDTQQHCAEADERTDATLVERIGLVGDQAVPAARIMSAAFSAAMMVGPLVFPEVTVGKIDVSTTRRRSTP
jgi:hypothetical protein